jgi:hypothetical protein
MPTAKPASIRSLLTLAAEYNWEIHQVDVKSAFLNGTLDEEIYMEQAPYHVEPGKEDMVCLMKKAIYRLKQAGHVWHICLTEVLTTLGFEKCAADHAVFFRIRGPEIFFIPTHVDDLTLICNSVASLVTFKNEFSAHLEISDLGEAHWLLGIQITRDRAAQTLSISQTTYIDMIITWFNLEKDYPLLTPLNPNIKLSKDLCPNMVEGVINPLRNRYQEVIGSLMYAATSTRPDISYAVTFLLQFLVNPSEAHLNAAYRIIRYLNGTRTYHITYGTTNTGFYGYSDADWASSQDCYLSQ